VARPDRVGAAAGLIGVAGNVLGVAFLVDVPGAYRPAGLDLWATGALVHPAATVASSLAFTLGLLALAAWARVVGRRAGGPLGRAGGSAMALGAVLNAAGTVTPAVLVLHVAPGCVADACAPVARALLGVTLSLDALFNLLFGAGLALASLALWRRERRPVVGLAGAGAGLATVLVSGQVASDAAARWLALAGPLWLAWVVAVSIILWRGLATRAVDGGGGHAALAGSR
jgi:hypothetical protein